MEILLMHMMVVYLNLIKLILCMEQFMVNVINPQLFTMDVVDILIIHFLYILHLIFSIGL
jgi:hypothetical protein